MPEWPGGGPYPRSPHVPSPGRHQVREVAMSVEPSSDLARLIQSRDFVALHEILKRLRPRVTPLTS